MAGRDFGAALAAFGGAADLPVAGGGGKPEVLARVSDDLIRLWDASRDAPGRAGVLPEERGTGLNVADGYVTVDAAAAGGNGAELLGDLRALGLEDGASFDAVVSGRLPIDRIDEVAGLDSLGQIAPAYAVTQVGAVTSQGRPAMNADDASDVFDVDGSGVSVGVLSDSFDAGPGSYAADVRSGDLPRGVDVLADLASGSDEGRAMLQLVHDVAPGADLAFHTAFNGQADFAQGIIDLREAGADVIVDDVIYLAEPMFMDGVVAQAADRVFADGAAYFSSAGNQDREAYEAAYRPAAVPPRADLLYDAVSAHDFDPGPGVDALQRFTLAPGATIRLTFQWADPFLSASGGAAGARTDLDAYILDRSGTAIAGSVNNNIGGDPVEILTYRNLSGSTQPLDLVLTKFGGPDPARIKYVDFGDAEFTEHVTASGASYGHASAQGAEGVGAAFYAETPAFGVSPPLIEPFSSAGGTPILFDEDGRRLANPENRQRVDVTAPDGTDTTFFGSFADPGPFPNFFGTSAAAPHAAAVAALMLDARPGLSPARIYDGLERTATDMDDPSTPGFDRGFDQVSGFGLVRADAAVARLVGGGPIAGGRGDDRLGGTARAELIEGRSGDDALRGLAGRDALSGDEGDDRLEGGGGDVLAGGLGDDASTGGAGSDRFVVSPGSDTVADFARGGGDTIDLTSILLGAAQTGAELDDFLRFADLGGGRGTRLDVDVEGERDFAAADSTTFEGVGLVVAGQSQARLIERLVAEGDLIIA